MRGDNDEVPPETLLYFNTNVKVYPIFGLCWEESLSVEYEGVKDYVIT